ncbi:hypothetical protein GHK92_01185 [Nocardioides sp. dk4132]|uniref:hypothetical protein n=1 Tax=unclassified Nocardioides TaxID=2615069 RepID=UPI001297119C|nr:MULTISPECIES: hypothetical protein [unclassified Nocardioides]MQW74481.1 hypothetical protein [Nocardioides sp. dk4132]QGA06412.1 hypothetical protein GFH29_02630 [Nocardioides sp. dk884]
MRLARSVRLSVAAVACTGLLALSACSGDSEPEAKEAESSEAPAGDAAAEVEATPVEGQPDWANPLATGGELISTFDVGDITVEVHQVGTDTAERDGTFVNSETEEPLLAKGEEIVFVNYVITNNGDPIDLGPSLVKITPRYDDWEYLIGMDSMFDADQFEELGVNIGALGPDGYREPAVYPFGAGETYSYAENFIYQENSPITFTAEAVPVDAEGESLQRKRLDGSGTATIR